MNLYDQKPVTRTEVAIAGAGPIGLELAEAPKRAGDLPLKGIEAN